MGNQIQNAVRLYRLKVIDVHGTAYVVIGSKNDVGGALEWLTAGGGDWLELSGFDDEADRRPLSLVVARESIAGMILSRV